MSPLAPVSLFNSPLETGTRSVILLDAAGPKKFDLTQLTWLDHLVVHTTDIDGPPSLHPNIPQRTGELIVRRTLIESGLHLMHRLHMVTIEYSSQGILFSAGDDAAPFVQLIRTQYGRTLKSRAAWLVGFLDGLPPDGLANLIREKIGRWNIEFQSEGGEAK